MAELARQQLVQVGSHVLILLIRHRYLLQRLLLHVGVKAVDAGLALQARLAQAGLLAELRQLYRRLLQASGERLESFAGMAVRQSVCLSALALQDGAAVRRRRGQLSQPGSDRPFRIAPLPQVFLIMFESCGKLSGAVASGSRFHIKIISRVCFDTCDSPHLYIIRI